MKPTETERHETGSDDQPTRPPQRGHHHGE
jgi:hypothetical protein